MRKTTLLITILFLFINRISQASAGNAYTNALTGAVTDAQTHRPLIGATVYLPDLKAGTVTDKEGHYRLDNLPTGRYLVQVQYVGYNTLTLTLDIRGTLQHDFTLSSSVLEQNEVVVTGLSAATEARKSPTPIEVISMKQLGRRTYSNVIDAIAKQPGVSQVTTGPAVSKPVIRGLGYNRVVVVNDGIRQEGQQWGDEHGIEVDDYNVNKIEILKGPASLMYGSDALAGVMNIISNLPAPQGTVSGNVAGEYQTNSGLFALHGNIKGNLNGFNWNAYGTRKQSHDYRNKYDGYVFNSKFGETNFGGYAGLNKSWGYTHLQFASFNEELGIVEGSRDSLGRFTKPVTAGGVEEEALAGHGDFMAYRPEVPRQKIVHNKWVLDNNFYLADNSRLALTLGYQQNLRREYGDVLQPGIPGLFLRLNTFNYDTKYFFHGWNGWQLAAGVNGMAQQNKNKGLEFLVPDYGLFDIGVFAYAKKDFDKLSLSGGIRVDNRSINADALFLNAEGEPVSGKDAGADAKFSAFSRNFSDISGSVGVSYAASSRLTLKFNMARGFRAPNIAELSANGVHEGTIKYEYGNTDLHPEVSYEADAGADWNSEHVSFTASLFGNYIRDYIFSHKLVSVSGGDSIPAEDNDAGYAAFRYDQQDALLYGGELTLDIHPHPWDWLHFENTVSYVRGRMLHGTDSTRNLPMMPAPRWISELRGDFAKKGKVLRNVYLKIEFDKYFSQDHIFSAYQTETATPGYGLLNAGIGADVANGRGHTLFTVSLSAGNITNAAFQNHLSRLKYADENPLTGRIGVFNMGRNFSVKVEVPLVFK